MTRLHQLYDNKYIDVIAIAGLLFFPIFFVVDTLGVFPTELLSLKMLILFMETESILFVPLLIAFIYLIFSALFVIWRLIVWIK